MPRKRTFTEFSPEAILASMQPGRDYRSGVIAQSLGVYCKDVRPVLDRLVAEGRLLMRYDEKSKEYRFFVRTAQSSQVPPPRTANLRLSELLSDYEKEMRERVALCMMIRCTV